MVVHYNVLSVCIIKQVLLKNLDTAKISLAGLCEIGEELKHQVDSSAAATILSDHLSLCQRLSVLEQALQRQQAILQVLN